MFYVGVIGPGEHATAAECDLARSVGRLLAEAGGTVVTGGLGGVMAAAAEGARAGGAQVVGLLPGPDRSGAAPDLSIAVPTGLGELRNALLVRAVDALVAVGGSWGTLSEVALARRTGRPVVCLVGWHVQDAAGRPVRLDVAASPQEAVAWVLARVRA